RFSSTVIAASSSLRIVFLPWARSSRSWAGAPPRVESFRRGVAGIDTAGYWNYDAHVMSFRGRPPVRRCAGLRRRERSGAVLCRARSDVGRGGGGPGSAWDHDGRRDGPGPADDSGVLRL